MDRRGFLGVLAALPIIKGMVPKHEQEITTETINKVLNLPINDPVWNSISCSGTIESWDHMVVSGSGTYRI